MMTPDDLEEVRRSRGWSMRELARRTGLSTSLLSKMEGGTRAITADSEERIRGALSTSTAYVAPVDDHGLFIREGDEIELAAEKSWSLGILLVTMKGERTLALASEAGGLRLMRRLGDPETVLFHPEIHAVEARATAVHRRL